MTNHVGFLCSIILLIFSLSYTDAQWNDERWDGRISSDEGWNSERSNDERWYNERSSNERWNNERWNNERSNDERWNSERSDSERWNNERLDNGRKNNDKSNDGTRTNEERNNERWNDESRNNERSNDQRRNNERSNNERQNNERSNEKKRNNERSNGERRNNDRSNNERRNNDRSNDETRNNNRPNDETRNNNRPNDETRNNDRFNNERRNDERRNDERSGEDRHEEDRLLSFADKCPADKMMEWSYRGNNGVLMWSERYPECGGRAQSPIAINSYEAIFDEGREKLKFHNYQTPLQRARIENDGHTIQITPSDDVQRVIHFDSTTYRLTEVHFHWGDDKSHGSEHTFDFIRYALEMHLVHQSGVGRTAVVAVFFREQSQPSKDLQTIIQAFPKVMYRDNSTELKSPINLNNLLPANPASYYWYEGSLTTPPCTEGVQWLLLPKIMPVGTKQMAEFRKLYSSAKRDSNQHCKLSNNYRPLQSLNGRMVVISQ